MEARETEWGYNADGFQVLGRGSLVVCSNCGSDQR